MPIDVKKPGRRTRGGKGGNVPVVPKAQDIYDVPYSNGDQLSLPLNDIAPNPFNKRKMRNLDEMAASIAQHGLDTPVTVMHTSGFIEYWSDRYPVECAKVAKLGKTYILGPGERRLRGAELAAEETGITTIPAVLRDDQIPTIRETLFRENYQRENPSPLERARDIQELIETEGMTYPEVCKVLNIQSKGTITKLLGLLKLSSEIQKAVDEKQISQATAIELGALEESEADVALRLIIDEGMKSADAVHHARTRPVAVSDGNTSTAAAQQEDASADESSEPAVEPARVPEPNTSAQETDPDSPVPDTDVPATMTTTPTTTPSMRTPTVPSVKDQAAADRATSAREREHACINWLQNDELPDADQLRSLVQHALLVGGKFDGRAKAHTWLMRAGKAHFDIKDLDGYFGAVLSSGNDELVLRATWATALASCESRAADRRRPGWDAHDAAHVRDLMTAVGYTPTTPWETSELERLGVSVGNDPDHSDQESA